MSTVKKTFLAVSSVAAGAGLAILGNATALPVVLGFLLHFSA